MEVKSIRQIDDLTGKKVLVRADFNVPLSRGSVKEDYKIAAGLSTIRYLARYGCKIAVVTHLGDPGGKKAKNLSTAPVAKRLAKLLGVKVVFVPDCLGAKVVNALNKLKPGEVLFLENLRYYQGEEKNDAKFAKSLAKPFDLVVNNAFAVSHRNHASVAAIRRYKPFYAGLLLEDEVENLGKTLKPKKPLTVIIGGAKVSTKLPLIINYLPKADHILVGGAIANDFLKGLGYEVGRSVVGKDAKMLKQVIEIYKKAGNKKIILPVDFVVSSRLDGEGEHQVKSLRQIDKEDFILDIGPHTVRLYAKYIKAANTLVWNGPMGLFEVEVFKYGTLGVARLVAARSTGHAYGVAGGGETVEALKMTKMLPCVDWVSTGGGAMLDFLAGAPMPGLKGLVR